MINLLLAIIFPVTSIVVFKFFKKYKVNTLQAIVINYIGAAIIGIFLSKTKIDFFLISNAPWIYISGIVGVLFLLNFYFIAKTTQKIGISIATLSNKVGLIIPIIAAFVFFKEEITFVKIIGIVFVFISVYLITYVKGSLTFSKKYLYLPILIMLLSGITDTLLKYVESLYINTSSQMGEFITVTFVFSFLAGFLFILPNIKSINFNTIVAGLILSIPNAFGVYFVLKSLNGVIESSLVFPILNVGSLFFAVLIGYFAFKEKLALINWIGVLLALFTILLLSF